MSIIDSKKLKEPQIKKGKITNYANEKPNNNYSSHQQYSKIRLTEVKDFDLNINSFVLAGQGISSDACQKPHMVGYNLDNITHDVTSIMSLIRCERLQCHNCYNLIISEKVYSYAIKLWSYHLETGNSIWSISVSHHPDFYKNIHNATDLLTSKKHLVDKIAKKRGMHSGLSVLHPFSIQDSVRKRMRSENINGIQMWNGVRENIYDYDSYQDYLYFHIHYHMIGFADNDIDEYNKDGVVLKKLRRLETLEDVIKTLKYVFNHIATFIEHNSEGQLIDVKTTSCFGKIHNYNPSLNPCDIITLKEKVASSLGGYYQQEKDKFSAYPENDTVHTHLFHEHNHTEFERMHINFCIDNGFPLPSSIEPLSLSLREEREDIQCIDYSPKDDIPLDSFAPVTIREEREVDMDKSVCIPDCPIEITYNFDFLNYCINDLIDCEGLLFNSEGQYTGNLPASDNCTKKTPTPEVIIKYERFRYIEKCIRLYNAKESDPYLSSDEKYLFISNMPKPPVHMKLNGYDPTLIRYDKNMHYDGEALPKDEFGTDYVYMKLKYRDCIRTGKPYTNFINDEESFSYKIWKHLRNRGAWKREKERIAIQKMHKFDGVKSCTTIAPYNPTCYNPAIMNV
jgi:hypothetical protein